jgi:hypothetical protein
MVDLDFEKEKEKIRTAQFIPWKDRKGIVTETI